MMLTPLQQAAMTTPDHSALIINGHRQSYQSWAQEVQQLAAVLHAKGLTQGSLVGVIIPIPSANNASTHQHHSIAEQTKQVISLYWACCEIGAIFFPLNGRFAQSQINQLLNRFNIGYLWASDSQLSQLKATLNSSITLLNSAEMAFQTQPHFTTSSLTANKINPHLPANVILTSGSSGTPKAAVHSLLNHIVSAQGSSRAIPLAADHRWLLSLPLFHIGGLAIVNRCALASATLVLQSDSQTLAEQMISDAITHVSMVPTQAIQMINHTPDALNQVKALLLGGGVIESSLISQLKQQGIHAYTSYGMTEMSSQITTAKANLQQHHGRPLSGRQLKLVDGVIWVKGECLFQGYLSFEAKSKSYQIHLPVDEQGWFCTHDRGQLNDKGQLTLLGRADNMFICGGENIQPEEVESVLLQHPLVNQAIVFGQADAKFGLLPAAIIGYNTTDLPTDIEQQLAQMVSQQLASFKRPRQFFNWPAIATQGLKINRKQMIAAVSSHHLADKDTPQSHHD
ncbi:o-succinylbenzoate--CoA ligase [Shewanella aestuarii]|uniref:O-succinylbenzoate--CoA ligase n=1 Tax=Shewanella aestuarii TaxID=1028752 RepID=A0A6G9QN25_9GAMM|nr:o-succinylbenzoate--CoA ligase [Shewanella aestuarii]QIR15882.1 o-succinylbenzoate--CoA ligase [Shewanella aestuarii]